MATIDRTLFFDAVRDRPFGGALTQGQVDGMAAILDAYESDYNWQDLRWLAYAFATTLHETASEMQPIVEYGKGQGSDYGEPDPKTGETYYGRGYVQLTWASNYQRADSELHLTGDKSCYLHADNALEPSTAAKVMFQGMSEGWFRTNSAGAPQTLALYFNDTRDDPYGAREIINGDKTYTPDWAGGRKIGDLIADYHRDFLDALSNAYVEIPIPGPPPFTFPPIDYLDPENLRRLADGLYTLADLMERAYAQQEPDSASETDAENQSGGGQPA